MNDMKDKQAKWEKYQTAYNELSDKLIDTNIDFMMLKKVVDYLEEYLK